jgi:hypothetical protein
MKKTRKQELFQLTWLAALTFVTLLVLTLLINLACRSVLTHSDFRLSQAAKGTVHTKLLTIGNSRGVNLLEASRPGPAAFNLSYNGLTRESMLALVKDFYGAGNSASAIAIEASGLLVSGPNCDLKPYWGLLPNFTRMSQAGCRTDAWMADWFPLTRYDTELFQRAAYYLLRRNDQSWANESIMTQAACAHPPTGQIGPFATLPSAAEVARIRSELQELKSWLAQRGLHPRIAIVEAPFFPAPETAKEISAARAANDEIFGPDGYLDLTASMPHDCSQFADPLHLNSAGRAAIRDRVLAYALKTAD